MPTMNVTVEMPELYNISHAAEYIGVSRPTIYYMLARGILPVVEIDGRQYIPKTNLDKWLAERPHP